MRHDLQGGGPNDPAGGLAPRPVTFKPGRRRVYMLIAAVGFAVFWNSGIAGMTAYLLGCLRGDEWDFAPMCMMAPCILLGGLLIIAAQRQLLLVLSPAVVLDLGSGVLRPGGSTSLRWRTVGRTRRVTKVIIKLIAEEQHYAPSNPGKIIKRRIVYEQLLIDPQRQADFETIWSANPAGETTLKMSAEAAGLRGSDRSDVQWMLVVETLLKGRDDPAERYPLRVVHGGSSERAAGVS